VLGEHGVHCLVQIAVVERQVFPDAVFEGPPVVRNGVEVWGVRGQEFLRAPGPLNEAASFGGLMETGVVIDHKLSWFQNGGQTVLNVGFKARGVASPREHEGGAKGVLVERIKQAHPLRAMTRLLAPTRFARRTPAVRPSFGVIHARLIQRDNLLGGDAGQLLAKLLPQSFVPLGIGEGLLLCV
jgi:hypothetical protein